MPSILLGLWLISALGVSCTPPMSASAEQPAASPPVAAAPALPAQTVRFADHEFAALSPTGERLFESALSWSTSQPPEIAQPKMCAENVQRVYEAAGLAQFADDGEWWSGNRLMDAVRQSGGQVIRLPFLTCPDDPRAVPAAACPEVINELIPTFQEIFNGRLPPGILVNGCWLSDCSSTRRGVRHSSMLGHVTREGDALTYWLWHNNWYQPDDDPQHTWRLHMVSPQNLQQGLRRQWMATPWLTFRYGAQGEITEIRSEMPAIVDLDPTTRYYITLSIPHQLLEELDPP